jgi:pyruvate/2-oxoglutarate dehydrogenase complex dihydrolipoamide acyltransferase (E2) component
VKNKITKLDYAERWLRDGLPECGRAGGLVAIQADASTGIEILESLRSEGVAVTWTHVFVRAVAMVLSRHPQLHQLVAGNLRLSPSTVDICLSIAGDLSVTPVLIIEQADGKNLREIAAEIRRRTPEASEEHRKMMGALRRFGWLVPFSGMRRQFIGWLLRRPWYRRKVSGTFQVTCLPPVDLFVPFLFNTTAALGVGQVCDRVVAVNRQAVVCPTVIFCCAFDHAVWNGSAAATFLTALRTIIESGEFAEVMVPQSDQPAGLVSK